LAALPGALQPQRGGRLRRGWWLRHDAQLQHQFAIATRGGVQPGRRVGAAAAGSARGDHPEQQRQLEPGR
jgi:hypothetical protein